LSYICEKHKQFEFKSNNEKRRQTVKSFTVVQLTRAILLTLLLSAPTFAQYGGGTGSGGTGSGSGAPSYGSGKAVGIGVGAAAAGAGVLYLALHHKASLTGCVQRGDDGLSLVDDKNHQTYSLLIGDADLKSGERVELKGKKSKDGSGAQSFQVNKVVKNLGACTMQSADSSMNSR
jgi:hypothetical protein